MPKLNHALGQRSAAIRMVRSSDFAGAKENGYLPEEAFANELAAKFYLDWGTETVADQLYAAGLLLLCSLGEQKPKSSIWNGYIPSY